MVRAVTDTPAAVYAELIDNMGFPIMYTNCLGRAILDTINTALAEVFLESDRPHKFVHDSSFRYSDS